MAASRLGVLRTLVTALRTATRPGSPGPGERLAALPRLVRATLRGEYHGTTTGRLLMIAAAAAYVLSPVDLVPEAFLAVLGLADDAMVASWAAAALVNETEGFLAWERSGGRAWTHRARTGDARTDRPQTVPGEVIG